jgi:hypothetical protein
MPRRLVGGTQLVGRRYFVGPREVEVLTGWGPGARMRNVLIRFRDTGECTVRPFRGLTLAPRRAAAASAEQFPGDEFGRAQPRFGGR